MTVVHHADLIVQLRDRGFVFETFFDVGASIGRWSTSVAGAFPGARFEMFEPLAGRVEEVDAKGMWDKIPNAHLHKVALSDETGPTEIKVLGAGGVGSSILVMDGDRRKNLTIIPCEQWRMDDIVADRGLPQPDFIKLDTQAGELKVLKGAVETIKGAKFILLETWIRRVYGPGTPLFHEVAAWLYDQGYVLYDMMSLDEGRDADGTLRWFDAVFINKTASTFAPRML